MRKTVIKILRAIGNLVFSIITLIVVFVVAGVVLWQWHSPYNRKAIFSGYAEGGIFNDYDLLVFHDSTWYTTPDRLEEKRRWTKSRDTLYLIINEEVHVKFYDNKLINEPVIELRHFNAMRYASFDEPEVVKFP